MMRISTTTVEQFRRLLTYDYVDEAELVAQVKREPFGKSWQMAAGSAWDAVLCDPAKHRKSEYRGGADPDVWFESGGYIFDAVAVEAALAELGDGIFQVKATREFVTPFGPANIVAQADHVCGLTITDNKAKFSTPHASDYEQDVQWRFYLLVHGAECFRYLLYDFMDPKDGYCKLKEIHPFRFWRHVGIENSCQRWLNLFLEWCDSKGLLPYLHREGTLAAA